MTTRRPRPRIGTGFRWALDRRSILTLGLAGAAHALVETVRTRRAIAESRPVPHDDREKHLKNVRQLTFGGQNAEAYFDWSGTKLIFQSTRPPFACDQMFTMTVDGEDVRLVSTGRGRTTCGFFFPDGKRFIYASTHFADPGCPPQPDRSRGYVWPIYPGYEIVSAGSDGSPLTRLTNHDGYDAEGAVSPDGRRIVFTSLREGDLDLHLMDADGRNVRRLTQELGYDGGPFFSWDGRFIVYRAYRPETPAEVDEYRALLAQSLVRGQRLELFLMRADGSDVRQITRYRAASFAPFMHPNGHDIVFSSNMHEPGGRGFALYLVRADGRGLERVTWTDTFASFPMFSRDGSKLAFCSTRGARSPRELNVFVADWVA